MGTKLRPFIILFLACIWSVSLGAQAPKKSVPKKPATKTAGQWAKVQTDGSAVYKNADFDSEVITYLDAGKKVRISKKIFPGPGGLGSFYRVKIGKVVGYITDVDVVTQFHPGEGKSASENPSFSRTREQEDESRNPPERILLSRYIGGSLALVDFTEEIANKEKSASTLMYGVRISGPGALMADYPIDFSFLFLMGAPDYYDDIQGASASGLLLISDFTLPVPILEGNDSLIYTGLGLTINYSKFDVKIDGDLVDSQEVRMGAVFPFGWALRLTRKWLSRLEARYYFEEEKYTSIMFGLQREY